MDIAITMPTAASSSSCYHFQAHSRDYPRQLGYVGRTSSYYMYMTARQVCQTHYGNWSLSWEFVVLGAKGGEWIYTLIVR